MGSRAVAELGLSRGLRFRDALLFFLLINSDSALALSAGCFFVRLSEGVAMSDSPWRRMVQWGWSLVAGRASKPTRSLVSWNTQRRRRSGRTNAHPAAALESRVLLTNTLPTIESLAFANPSASYGSANGNFVGSLTDATPSSYCTIEIDTSGDLISDVSGGAYYGSFDFSSWISLGTTSVNARAIEYDSETGQYASSNWQQFAVSDGVVANSLPVIASLGLTHDTETPGDLSTSEARLSFTLTDVDPSYYYDLQFDINGDGVSDVSGYAYSTGAYEQGLSSYLGYGLHTVKVRAIEYSMSGPSVQGAWSSLTFTYEAPPANAAPTIQNLGLENDTGTPGDNVTTNPRITGTLSDPDGGGYWYSAEIDWNNDGMVDDTFSAYTGGMPFTYDLTGKVSHGTVSAKVRGVQNGMSDTLRGEWSSLAFTYEAPPANAAPTIQNLGLENDTGTPGDNVTTDPRVTGTLSDPDGGGYWYSAEIDWNNDGMVDDTFSASAGGMPFTYDLTGKVSHGTVNAKVRGVQNGMSDTLRGSWSSLAFTYEQQQLGSAPTVSLSNAVNALPESTNVTNNLWVAGIAVTDDGMGTNILSLSGADASLFTIAGTSLYLKAGTTLDHETHSVLNVTVNVDDASLGSGVDNSQALAIAISNVNEAPTVSLTNTNTSLVENLDTTTAIKVAEIVVSDDALGTNVLSLTGADATLFEIVGMNLYLKAGTGLDYETHSILDVTVSVDDLSLGSGADDSQALAISITNVIEPSTVTLTNATISLPERVNISSDLLVAGIVVTSEGVGTSTLSLSGTDASLFEIVGTNLYLKAGTSLSHSTHPTLNVTVSADNVSDSLTISVAAYVPSVVDLDALSDSGASNTDNITNDSTPTFIGTGTPGSLIQIYANGVLVGSGVISAEGDYSVASDPLSEGTYAITSTEMDQAGHESDASEAMILVVSDTDPLAIATNAVSYLLDKAHGSIDFGLNVTDSAGFGGVGLGTISPPTPPSGIASDILGSGSSGTGSYGFLTEHWTPSSSGAGGGETGGFDDPTGGGNPTDSMTLKSGTVITSHSDFVLPIASRSNSFVRTTGLDTTSETSTQDEVTYTTTGTTAWTYTVSTTLTSDGWAYLESYDTITRYGVVGTDGSTSIHQVFNSYLIMAEETSAHLSFTLTIAMGDVSSGQFSTSWDDADADGNASDGTITWNWSDDCSTTVAIEHETILAANQEHVATSYTDTSSSLMSGTGHYSYSVSGGLVSGTSESESGESSQLSSRVLETKNSDGTWTTDSGISSGSGASFAADSFSGKGTYHTTTKTSDVTGKITEQGHTSSTSSYSFYATLGVDDEWVSTAGKITLEGDSGSETTYSGFGTYLDDSTAGKVSSGNITEFGGTSTQFSFSGGASIGVDGAWTGAMSASGSTSSDDVVRALGTYKSTDKVGSIDGQTSTDFSSKQSADFNFDSVLSPDETWKLSSGEAHASGETHFLVIVSGSGSYSYNIEDQGINGANAKPSKTGTISGTRVEFSESYYDQDFKSSQSVGTEGKWESPSGTQVTKEGYSVGNSFSGSGTYLGEIIDGTVTGTITESGDVGGKEDTTVWSSMDQEGKWQDSSGTIESSAGTHLYYGFSGSGSYARKDARVDASGSYLELVSTEYNYDEESKGSLIVPTPAMEGDTSTTPIEEASWDWTSGSAKESTSFTAFIQYSGKGIYTDSFTNGNFKANTFEKVVFNQSESTKIDKEIESDGTWTDSAGERKSYSDSLVLFGISGQSVYSDTTPGQTMSMTVNIKSGSRVESNESTTESLQPDGKWQLETGDKYDLSVDYYSTTISGKGSIGNLGNLAVPGISLDLEISGGDISDSRIEQTQQVTDHEWETTLGLDTNTNSSMLGVTFTGGGVTTGYMPLNLTISGAFYNSASHEHQSLADSKGEWTEAFSLDNTRDINQIAFTFSGGDTTVNAGATTTTTVTGSLNDSDDEKRSQVDGSRIRKIPPTATTSATLEFETVIQGKNERVTSTGSSLSLLVQSTGVTVTPSGNDTLTTDYDIEWYLISGYDENTVEDLSGPPSGLPGSTSSLSGTRTTTSAMGSNGTYTTKGTLQSYSDGGTLTLTVIDDTTKTQFEGMTVNEVIATDGTWFVDSGKAVQDNGSTSIYIYSGIGTYSHPIAGGTISGGITSSTLGTSLYRLREEYDINPGGTQTLYLGTLTDHSDSWSTFDRSGSGFYAYSVVNGAVNGTASEKYHSDSKDHSSRMGTAQYGGIWLYQGMKSSQTSGFTNSKSSGAGGYADVPLELNGRIGTETGTITEEQKSHSLFASDSAWDVDFYTGEFLFANSSTKNSGTSDSSSLRKGTYTTRSDVAISDFDGRTSTMSGTNEDESELHSESKESTLSVPDLYDPGEKITTGARTFSTSGSGHASYSGSGGYVVDFTRIQYQDNTKSTYHLWGPYGTMKENGDRPYQTSSEEQESLQSNGNWLMTSGQRMFASTDEQSYSASANNLRYTVDEVTTEGSCPDVRNYAGTVNESEKSSSHEFTLETQDWAGNGWVHSGVLLSSGDGTSTQTHIGAGTYQRPIKADIGITGTLTHEQKTISKNEYDITQTVDPTGALVLSAGTKSNFGFSDEKLKSTGSGEYERYYYEPGFSYSVSGTFTDRKNDSTMHAEEFLAWEVLGGKWAVDDASDRWTESTYLSITDSTGSGVFIRDIGSGYSPNAPVSTEMRGTVTGTMNEQSNAGRDMDIFRQFTANKNGEWQLEYAFDSIDNGEATSAQMSGDGSYSRDLITSGTISSYVSNTGNGNSFHSYKEYDQATQGWTESITRGNSSGSVGKYELNGSGSYSHTEFTQEIIDQDYTKNFRKEARSISETVRIGWEKSSSTLDSDGPSGHSITSTNVDGDTTFRATSVTQSTEGQSYVSDSVTQELIHQEKSLVKSKMNFTLNAKNRQTTERTTWEGEPSKETVSYAVEGSGSAVVDFDYSSATSLYNRSVPPWGTPNQQTLETRVGTSTDQYALVETYSSSPTPPIPSYDAWGTHELTVVVAKYSGSTPEYEETHPNQPSYNLIQSSPDFASVAFFKRTDTDIWAEPVPDETSDGYSDGFMRFFGELFRSTWGDEAIIGTGDLQLVGKAFLTPHVRGAQLLYQTLTSCDLRDLGHLTLDLAGMLPVVGWIPDAINAAWYYGEGNYRQAAFSAMSAIPGIGDALGVAKFGLNAYRTGFKCVNAATDAGRFVRNMRSVERGINFVQGASGAIEGYQNGDVIQMGMGLLGMGMAARATQLPCFVAGTLVATPEGPKAIETILSGDLVCGYDLRSGEWRDCLVSYHSSLASDDLIVTVRARLPKSSETSEVCELAEVRSTYHHPYWVVSGEDLDERPVPDQLGDQLVSVDGVPGRWVDAGDLRVGDVLLSRTGGNSTVESVETEHTQTRVYHIYVEELHNYSVGNAEWLVHNGHETNSPGYRALSDSDLASYMAGKRIMPKGSGGKIIDHIKGFDTKYISLSQSRSGVGRFIGSNGVVEVDLDALRRTGSGIVPHEQVLQAARRLGSVRDVENVISASEILVTGGIDPSAILRIIGL